MQTVELLDGRHRGAEATVDNNAVIYEGMPSSIGNAAGACQRVSNAAIDAGGQEAHINKDESSLDGTEAQMDQVKTASGHGALLRH